VKSAAKSEPKIRDHHFHPRINFSNTPYVLYVVPQSPFYALLELQRIKYKGGRKEEHHKLTCNDYTPYLKPSRPIGI
jgi:hypothetical protein